MLKKLMLMLFLSLVMSGTAAPILKSFFGIGSSAAYAQMFRPNDDDDQGDNDSQGQDEQ